MQLRQQSEKFNDIFNKAPSGPTKQQQQQQQRQQQQQSSQKRKYKKHVSLASNGGNSRGSASHANANKATTKSVTKQTNGISSRSSSHTSNDGHSQHLSATDVTAARTRQATKDVTSSASSSSSSSSSFMLGKTIVSRYAPQTYDAVWAIALSLRAAEDRWRKDPMQQSKLDRFDYTRSDMATEFLQQMGKLDFLGVSVSVVKFCNCNKTEFLGEKDINKM